MMQNKILLITIFFTTLLSTHAFSQSIFQIYCANDLQSTFVNIELAENDSVSKAHAIAYSHESA